METANHNPSFNGGSKYPKLVRDNIPDIVQTSSGISVPVRILEDNTEYESFLRQKIVEEALELAAAESDSKIIEEAADLEEVLDAFLALRGIDRVYITAAQSEKRHVRGGFAKRILMLNQAQAAIKQD